MKLTHKSATKAYYEKIFENVYDMKTLMKNIENNANNIPLIFHTNDELENMSPYENYNPHRDRNVFKGNMFEVFVECFLKIFENDKDIGVHDVESVDITDDVGVDFIGKSTRLDENDICVQAKYRGRNSHTFTYTELSTFMSTSANYFKVTGRSQILITTAKYIKDKNDVVNYKVRIINPDLRVIDLTMLESKVDNNKGFWDQLRKLLEDSKKIQVSKNQYDLFEHQKEMKGIIEKWLTL